MLIRVYKSSIFFADSALHLARATMVCQSTPAFFNSNAPPIRIECGAMCDGSTSMMCANRFRVVEMSDGVTLVRFGSMKSAASGFACLDACIYCRNMPTGQYVELVGKNVT